MASGGTARPPTGRHAIPASPPISCSAASITTFACPELGTTISTLLQRLKSRAAGLARRVGKRADYSRYRSDPAGYCREVLRVRLTPAQEHIARLLTIPPFK